MNREVHDDASLVLAVRAGDEAAFGQLFSRWFDRCYDISVRILRDDGRAAEVAQDTFLAAWQKLDTLRDPGAFGGWVSRMARNRALNRLEHEGRATALDDTAPVFAERAAPDDVEADVTGRERDDLVAAAAAVLGPRDASVLDLHLRHGLGAAELADELGVTPNNAHQLMHRMKQRLGAGVRAWVLFEGGDPACERLRAELHAAGLVAFSAETARQIARHVDDCDECTDRQAAVLAPERLFASVPLLLAPEHVRGAVVQHLREAGVPLPESAASHPVTTGESGESGEAASDAIEPAAQTPQEAADVAVVVAASKADAPVTDDEGHKPVALLLLLAALVLLGLALLMWPDDPDSAIVDGGPATSSTTTEAPASTSTTATPMSTTTVEATTSTGVAPMAPGTTALGLTPPAPAPATPPSSPPPPPSTSSTTSSTTSTTTPPAPVVDAFRATAATSPGGACPASEWATTLAWMTTNATSVSISAVDAGPFTGLPGDGTTVACRLTASPPPGGWTLIATGPGGTDTATA